MTVKFTKGSGFRLCVPALLLLNLVGTYFCGAQTPDKATWSYEVALVRPSDPNSQENHIDFDNNTGAFTCVAMPLWVLVRAAYNLNFEGKQQIINAPSLLSSKFDIHTAVDVATVDAWQKLTVAQQEDRAKQMLRGLLEERFHLKVHHESRELPVYFLIVAKGGPKLTPAKQRVGQEERCGIRNRAGRIKGSSCSLEELALVMPGVSELGGRTVFDKTGLKGGYDFLLRWTPDDNKGRSTTGVGLAGGANPSFFTAFQEQLGLKLKPAKAPVEVLVIDSVEKPTEN